MTLREAAAIWQKNMKRQPLTPEEHWRWVRKSHAAIADLLQPDPEPEPEPAQEPEPEPKPIEEQPAPMRVVLKRKAQRKSTDE